MKLLRFLACLLLVVACVCSNVQGQIITTIAGNGFARHSGDGGSATNASLSWPTVVAADRYGNIFIAESWYNVVRKVNAAGIISTFAGNGTSGTGGDGGPATAAQLDNPEQVAVDRRGNVYVSDYSGHSVRKITTAGIINKIAGSGVAGFTGDGGPATAAQIGIPGGMAIDSFGNIFIADTDNHRIRKVDTSGIIRTIAGNGSVIYSGDGGPATDAGLSFVREPALDDSGNIYFLDSAHIRKINPAGVITSIAVPATTLHFTLDNIGNFYYDLDPSRTTTGTPKNRIFKITTSGYTIAIAGDSTFLDGFSGDGGAATLARFNMAGGIAVDSMHNVYVADRSNYRIRKIDTSGIISTIAGAANLAGDGGAATAAELNYPGGVAIDANRNVYIAEYHSNRIRKITPSGVISTIAGNGTNGHSGDGGAATAASLRYPSGIAVDDSGNKYIVNPFTIRKLTASGIISTIAGCDRCYSYSGDGGPATAATLNYPAEVAVDHSGNIYIADEGNHRIRKVTASGIISTIAGNGAAGYSGDGGAATAANLNYPAGIALDRSGNVYIGDLNNSRIRKVTPSGIISTIAGNGTSGYGGDGGPATAAQLRNPSCVVVDSFGNVFFADENNGRIRKITMSGTIITVAGNGSPGYSGDGGPATAAELNNPKGVALDGAGNLYFSDFLNFRIRKVDSCTSPSVATITGSSSICAGSSFTLADTTASGVWSSASPGVATISSTGVVTGVSGGIVNITYSVTNSCGSSSFATHSVTINPLPSVGIITGPSIVCEASTITLSDTATGGTWSSSNTSLATVNSSGIVTGVVAGTATISYAKTNSCGTRSAVNTITVNPLPHAGSITGPTVVCAMSAITLTDTFSGGTWTSSLPSIASVTSGGIVTGVSAGTTAISYSVTNSCGTSVATHYVAVFPLAAPGSISGPSTVCEASTITLSDTATGGTWSSSNTSLATVNTSGIVTGVAAGTVIISYTKTNSCGSRSAVDTIRVLPLPHSGIITGSATLCPGAALTLTDTATGGSWSSSSTSLATVNSSGVVTGIAAGSVTISYTVTNSCGTSVATHAITVNPSPVAGTLSGTAIVCLGVTDTLTMTGGSAGGTWTSSATGVATVSATGVVHGVSGGTTTISYTVTNSCGSASATRSVTISPFPSVAAITGASSVCPGATLTLADVTTGGTWSSSSTSVATISTSGVVTGVSGGTTLISYTVTNSCGSTSATVTMAVNPLPTAGTITGATTLCEGTTIALTDTALSGVWSSSNTTLATVDASGVVNGLVAGTDTIYYTVTFYCGSAVAMQVITVNPLPDPGTISGASTVCPGNTVTLTNPATSGTWSSDATGTATISATGTVTGVSTGTCNISYTVTNSCGTANATYPMTVLPLASCPSAVTITAPTKNKFSIYPNPAKEVFTVLVSSPFDEQLTIRITNVTGQLVKEFSGTTNQPSAIQLSQPSGVYFVTAITSRDRFVGEVVIAKQ